MENISLKLPPKLVRSMDELVDEGWYSNRGDVVRDALREKIKQLKLARLESAIKEDVEWGLSQ